MVWYMETKLAGGAGPSVTPPPTAHAGPRDNQDTNAVCKAGQRKTLSKPRIHPLQASRLIVISDSCKPDTMNAGT